MRVEKRCFERYVVLGRVQCDELCPLPGAVLDISLHGCKINYNVPVNVRLEEEYTLLLKTSDNSAGGLTLICQPIWVREDSGKTFIGMLVLRSPDSEKLNKYITLLNKARGDEAESENQIVDTQCQFL